MNFWFSEDYYDDEEGISGAFVFAYWDSYERENETYFIVHVARILNDSWRENAINSHNAYIKSVNEDIRINELQQLKALRKKYDV